MPPLVSVETWLNKIHDLLVGVLTPGRGAVNVNVAGHTAGVVTTTRMEQYKLRTGEVAGAVAATQFPQLACFMCRVKAQNDNAGNVYIGGAGVTVAGGTTDTTTGWQLDAGEETPWLLVSDMNQLFR